MRCPSRQNAFPCRFMLSAPHAFFPPPLAGRNSGTFRPPTEHLLLPPPPWALPRRPHKGRSTLPMYFLHPCRDFHPAPRQAYRRLTRLPPALKGARGGIPPTSDQSAWPLPLRQGTGRIFYENLHPQALACVPPAFTSGHQDPVSQRVLYFFLVFCTIHFKGAQG